MHFPVSVRVQYHRIEINSRTIRMKTFEGCTRHVYYAGFGQKSEFSGQQKELLFRYYSGKLHSPLCSIL